MALADARNGLAAQMINLLEGAAFNDQSINEKQAENLIRQANLLLEKMHQLASQH
jgi:hypothetical protein